MTDIVRSVREGRKSVPRRTMTVDGPQTGALRCPGRADTAHLQLPVSAAVS